MIVMKVHQMTKKMITLKIVRFYIGLNFYHLFIIQNIYFVFTFIGDSFENHDQYINETENLITVVKKTKKRGDYIRWTMAEIDAIKRCLGKFIALRKTPQQHDCLLAIKHEPILKNRDWKKIKFQVANIIKKTLK